jgi:hypothetical protein
MPVSTKEIVLAGSVVTLGFPLSQSTQYITDFPSFYAWAAPLSP